MTIDPAAKERYAITQAIANRRRRIAQSFKSGIPLRMFKSDGMNPSQMDLDRNIRAANKMHLMDLRHEKNGWPPEEE